jgi:septal ring factor EnvC (AmiA/AmiB activator)
MMKRLLFIATILAPALAAASVPIEPARETIGQALGRIAAETRAAEARVAVLEKREAAANDEAGRLRAERERAAADIAVTEARIASADLRLTAARLAVEARSASLARRQAPLAALLAGLATMGRRPPVLALADGTSISELVRIRALIDGSMPVIAQRSAALRAEIGEGRRLAAKAAAARREVAAARTELVEKQQQFAVLEAKASARAAGLRAEAAGADDQRLAGGETLLDLGGEAAAAAEARKAARALTALPMAPARPVAPDSPGAKPGIAYVLPTNAPVLDGLGTVSASGVRSRGLRFATARGSAILAPAAGTILFAGAYRDHDGIVVIDHGGGWTSLFVDVAPSVRRGDRVATGAPLGRALGDVALELREAGQPRSAALIAGSSRLLSNRSKLR